MGRAEISWKKRNDEGQKREVYAKHVGDQWNFFEREQRFDDWQPLAQPPLDDWLELLDGVRRRIGRRLLRPEEEERVIKAIRLRYPDAEV
jgi:hypothetical protein